MGNKIITLYQLDKEIIKNGRNGCIKKVEEMVVLLLSVAKQANIFFMCKMEGIKKVELYAQVCPDKMGISTSIGSPKLGVPQAYDSLYLSQRSMERKKQWQIEH